jgi:hypothetical protein
MPDSQLLTMSRQLRLRADRARARADDAVRRSQALIADTAAILAAVPSPDRLGYFMVCGRVEGRPVWAMWAGGHLSRSPALRARAEVLVAMGEQFCYEDSPAVITAALDEPLAALLTTIRACDQTNTVWLAAPPTAGALTW